MGLTSEQAKMLNLESIIDALKGKLIETEKDLRSLQVAHSLKGQKMISLEAEIVRLRMLRTDEQLRAEVDGLRCAVSKKDQEVSRLSQEISKMQGREKDLLSKAREAERRSGEIETRLEAFKETCAVMERNRDVANAVASEEKKAAATSKAEAEKAKEQVREALATSVLASRIVSSAERVIALLPSGVRGLKEVQGFAALLPKKKKLEKGDGK